MKKTDSFPKLVKDVFSGLRKPNESQQNKFFLKNPRHIKLPEEKGESSFKNQSINNKIGSQNTRMISSRC